MPWDEKTQTWALSLAAAVIGWLVKDFLLGTLAKREEAARKEWREMLTEIWSPLYCWSGVIALNDGGAKWGRPRNRGVRAAIWGAAMLPAVVGSNRAD
jgi:hypothetical protein